MENNPFLEEKIKITNFIAKTMIVLGFPFVAFGVFIIPFWGNLILIPYTLILFVPILNRYNFFIYSKTILGILVPFTAALYHAIIISNKFDPLPGFVALQFSLLIVPFLIFSTFEKKALIIFSLFNLFLIFFLPWYKNFIIVNFDSSLFHTSFFNHLSFITAAILFMLPYYNMLSQNEKIMIDLKQSEKEKNEYLKNQIKNNFEKNMLFNFSNVLSQINKNRNKTLSEALNFLSSNFFISVSYLYVQEFDEKGKEHLIETASYGKALNKIINWEVGKDYNLVLESFNKNEEMKISGLEQNHLRIYSALGETIPKEVRIIPINSNELKLGILELGFYKILLPEKNEVFYKCLDLLSAALLGNFSEEANKKILKDLMSNKNIF